MTHHEKYSNSRTTNNGGLGRAEITVGLELLPEVMVGLELLPLACNFQ